MIFKNNNKIVNIYRGTLPISNVYLGNISVYTGSGGNTYDYLTFTALELSKITYQPSDTTTAQYSYDKVNWETADNVQLSLNKGDKVYFKGEITGEQGEWMSALFRMSGKIEASGSIMSLQAGDPNDKTINYNYAFSGLFNYCSSLTTAPELPATTLTDGCYNSLFSNCTSLTTAPELPATTLEDSCYENMFYNCKALTTAPALPATTLANECYYMMFQDCTSLTTAPELPATTLAVRCYSSMFNGCTSLTTAPELPATTLVNNCYSSIFSRCSSLNYIKALFTTTPSNTYTSDWVYRVGSTGTFVKNSEATWDVTGSNGIPEGWTVETA